MMAIINNSATTNSSSSSTNTKLSSTANQNNSVRIASSSSSTTSSMEDENVICPLCMENLDIDDRSFYPCTCGYQICRFCWHRIRSESDDQNGLCPACRKQYSENPATFKPLSSEDIQKLKLQKRQKDQQKKQKSENGKRHLADLRVVQKNLVFVVGISPRIADPDVLKKNEFFGKFGKIHKVVVNPCLQGSTASAYITYIRSDDALRAIQSVNNIPFDGKTIKVSLGTTKYCSHFMRNQTCPKTECMYLHHYGDPDASFTKEDMQAGKHQEYEKKLLDEFNTHQNNNNNNEQQTEAAAAHKEHTAKQANGKEPAVKNGKGKVGANGSSIQQGVSYSTKLLVNNGSGPSSSQHPPQSSTPPEQSLPQKLLPDRTPPPVQSSTTPPPCSSSASSTSSSTEHNLATATTLLEHTILSEEDEVDPEDDDDEEEEFHEAISTSKEHIVQDDDPGADPFSDDFASDNGLDLGFDPFHETQKAFEEIINAQVVSDSQAEQSSLLRRFIKPQQEAHEQTHIPDYLLGFHHTPQQSSSPSVHHSQHPQDPSPYTPQSNSSLLLDFFNSYASSYKQPPHTQSGNIPPPPGFSNTTPSNPLSPQNSSSALLDKLNRTLLGTTPGSSHWGGGDLDEGQQRIVTNTSADWMSLDPAIIFSKTSSERNAAAAAQAAERQNANRNFIENPLHGLFGERGSGLGMHHQFLERERAAAVFQQQQQTQSAFAGQNQHPLIRPTPTSTSPQTTSPYYSNGLLPQQQTPQQYFSQQQQQRQVPQYYSSTVPPPQSRYYSTPSSQSSQVTPPPPGFGGLHTPLHKPQQQQQTPQTSQFSSVYVLQQMQQQQQGSGSNSAAGFFPF